MLRSAAFALALCLAPLAHAQETGPCGFNAETLSFRGDAQEQARCLLRPVQRGGVLGAPLAALPAPLDALVGQTNVVSRAQLLVNLEWRGIDPTDLGGPLADPVSQTSGGKPALYFVIHDTSTPNYLTEQIPATINDAAWRHNNLDRWRQGDASVAHIFVSRTGGSTTAIEFSRGWRATKLERNTGVPSRGRFLHIENVQPRRSLDTAPAGNDQIAPEPGFTDAQYRRLALLYVVASMRAGQWLIPAQHAVIDGGLPNAHDDPQSFDLARWVGFVGEEIASISGPAP